MNLPDDKNSPSRYDDIINLPHHVSSKHPRMPIYNRAAQFSPFAALVGYEDELRETARLTESRRELDEMEKMELDRRLRILVSKLSSAPEVSIRFFVPDARKSGGSYVVQTGFLRKITLAERLLLMSDGTSIPMDDIVEILSPSLDNSPSQMIDKSSHEN